MKKLCYITMSILFSFTAWAETFLFFGGYRNVKVQKISLQGIHITHEEGTAILKVDELSELQKVSLANEIALFNAMHKKKRDAAQKKHLRKQLKIEQEKELADLLKNIKSYSQKHLLNWLKTRNLYRRNYIAFERRFHYATNKEQAFAAISKKLEYFEHELFQQLLEECKNKDFKQIDDLLYKNFRCGIDTCTDDFLKKQFSKVENLNELTIILAVKRKEKENFEAEKKSIAHTSKSPFDKDSSVITYTHSQFATAFGMTGQTSNVCPNCGGEGRLKKIDMGNLLDPANTRAKVYYVPCLDCYGSGRRY